ncbi:MAG TPA: hypothetical protein VN610_09000, partial [Bryobacteraceae bacterium]|nr:hypothetical protein [Bryobacteraceae bacterium]
KRVKRWREYAELFHESDTAWFCFLYSLTFGGFVGLASYLPVFFHDQYGLSKVQAGDSTTIVVLFGSFLRPPAVFWRTRLAAIGCWWAFSAELLSSSAR